MTIVIYHNPACSSSRNVLRLIRDAGYDPVVVEYLESGWTRPQLQTLFAVAGLTPRAALRSRNTLAEELGLLDEGVSDDAILEQMVQHPGLVNRPIVASNKGVRLCRPIGAVLALLSNWPDGPWASENGTVIIGADGREVAPNFLC